MTIRLLKKAALAAGILSITSSALAAETVRWLNDWLPAGDKALVYLAAEKGYFEEEGVEVEIRSGRGSSDVVTKLATGSADMGTGGLGALLQAKAESNVGVTAVMSLYTKQPDAVLVDAASDIKTLKDLEGKTLATPTFSASNVTWPLVLKANDMSPDSVTLTKVDPGAMGPLMTTGRVDGTINWITKLPAYEALMAKASKEIRVLPWSEYGFDGYGLSVFASDEMLEERPEVVKKVLRAFKKAQLLALENPQAAGDAIKARVEDIDAAVAADEFAASIPLIDNSISEKDGLGVFEPELLAQTWKWVAEAQELPEDTLDPQDVVTNDYLPE